jgi:Tol biopolymer transport system component
VTSSNVWKQTIGSFARTRLTFGTSQDVSPAFTGDGEYITFASDRAGMNWLLWRISVKKPGGITKVTGSDARDYGPSVCRVTGITAYESIPTGAVDAQIWTINASGSLPTQLREGVSPQISPDGTKVLFVRKDTKDGRSQIWCMDIDGGQETQLTQNDTCDIIEPRWSPDGKWIVFASNEGLDMNKRPNYDIWMMRSDGSQKIQMTTNGSDDTGPCWDHTGKYIYFRSNRGALWNVWRFEPIIPEETVAGAARPAAE